MRQEDNGGKESRADRQEKAVIEAGENREEDQNNGLYVYADKKRLRCGYTTGTCAALAAKAAVRFLMEGSWQKREEILTPGGQTAGAQIRETSGGDGWASCAVQKDAGDDPDVTDGLLIFARAEFRNSQERILIDGGKGVGRVTKPGLDQPVGEAAINSVPRRMIADAVLEVLDFWEESRPVAITISVPEGENIAKKTFNPQLGIQGGISILGTSGIVKPMSEEALVETIRAELSVLKAAGHETAVTVPGNMGAGFLKRFWNSCCKNSHETENDVPLPVPAVTCSNYIGRTVDLAGELGFSGLLIAGHLGKLVKLGNGIMNTHSKEGDGRMDTLLSCALTAGAKRELLLKIQSANTTNEAWEILTEAGLHKEVMEILLERMQKHLCRRAADFLQVETLVFDSAGAPLGASEGAKKLLMRAMKTERGERENEY